MRLSEAIRLGAMTKPQAFGGRIDGGTCAREAACDAIGVDNWFAAPKEWLDWAYGNRLPCPVCGVVLSMSGVIALCLNDHHHWTREAIADFVELHEPESMLPENPTSELLDYWQSRSQLFERSELQAGVPREC